ncbi:hypothetical protein SAMN04489761_4012 [Tenacibaculum sp. MAR_2009_124]|uniref:hypothetical protein n=1 Tax=Tenacibaculum sp. MAR_2009_124 TaxID=1250059 RepID=UPI00089AD6E1|nr:hypothetical protein [Tenacibaculum sp. MAR_2009_124]SEC93469.1 hypothetical protein SAMN04489761_4012 [Tenacibaculum sp. MAR_2009_124]
MNSRIINKQFSELLNSEIGNTLDLENEDENIIHVYSDQYKKLSEEEKLLGFHNIITNSGRCGFANGGMNQYLLNTDSTNRYRVTIKTNWRSGIQSGSHYRTHIIEAGSKLFLGCTDSGYIPVSYYNRFVVGEVKIN